MKKILCVLSLCVGAAVFAVEPVVQTELATPAMGAASAVFPSEAERTAERQRLDQKSLQIEEQYKQDMKVCYQKFDVVSCRIHARDRRIEAIAAAHERANANAQKQMDHALKGTKRGDYEQKQREAEQHREDVAKRLRERNKEPAAPLPVPGR